jgi:Flp pilus assembly protein TadG
MSKEHTAMQHARGDRRDRGQILVIFVISVVAICAMVGLVLDGGSAFAQRRNEQNVADLAAMAGATAYLNTTGDTTAKRAAAEAAARTIATGNGYTHGTDNVVVDVATSANAFAGTVTVNITKPHRNTFAGIVGMTTWPVSVTATALASDSPNGANGAMPLIFNEEAFPGAICDESGPTPCTSEVYQLPGTGNEDVPQDATQFNWTIFCTANGNACNANSNGVKDLIDGFGSTTTVWLEDDIGPLNAGSHTTLFSALDQHTGKVFPVPVVDDDGEMQGWAYFKLISTEGGSEKVIRGYFVSPVNAEQLVVNPSGQQAGLETGVYTIRLTN